jgi:hypothetical protein
MPLQKLKLVFFLSIVVFSSALIADNYPKKILFIGNSYLYYNDSVHNHVKRMLIERYGDSEIITKSAYYRRLKASQPQYRSPFKS